LKILTALFLIKRPDSMRKASLNDGHLIAVKKQVHRSNGTTFEQLKYVKPEDAQKQNLKAGKTWQIKDKPGTSKEHANKHFTIKGPHATAKDHFHIEHENGQQSVVSSKHIMEHAHPVEGRDPHANLFDEHEVKSLPKKSTQKISDKDELYKQATEALDQFKTWLDKGKGVCSQLGHQTMTKSPDDVTDQEWRKPGGMLFIAGLKKEDRAESKVHADYNGDWSKIQDLVRGTIACDNMDDLAKTLTHLKKHGLKLSQQPKNRIANPTPEGYRDILMNVEFPNGHIGELQLHLKEMTIAKRDGHEPYVTMSKLDRKYIPPGTPREKWEDTDRRAYEHAFVESVDIYSKAWQKIAKGAASMQKAVKDAGKTLSAQKYRYYEKDNATFRGPAGKIPQVTEIRFGTAWKLYTGNSTAVVAYGNEINQQEAEGRE